MSDNDRLIASITAQGAARRLEDGCQTCGYSKVYCGCVTYIESQPCCSGCSH